MPYIWFLFTVSFVCFFLWLILCSAIFLLKCDIILSLLHELNLESGCHPHDWMLLRRKKRIHNIQTNLISYNHHVKIHILSQYIIYIFIFQSRPAGSCSCSCFCFSCSCLSSSSSSPRDQWRRGGGRTPQHWSPPRLPRIYRRSAPAFADTRASFDLEERRNWESADVWKLGKLG